MADSSLAPPADQEYEHRVVGYFKEALEEGDAFLRAQKGYNRIGDTITSIMGEQQDLRVTSLSSVTANHVGKIALDITAGLTDVKPFWEYKTFNKRYEAHTTVYDQ